MPRLIDLLVGIQCSDGFSVLITASGRHYNGEVLSEFFSIAIAYLNPQWDWMADVWLWGVLHSVDVGRWQWSARGIVGGSMCGNSHVYLSRFAAAFLAHGKRSAAESSANYDKQSGHVNIF